MLPNQEDSVPAANGITLLVVEDEEMVRSLFALVLRRAGYQVLEASHGLDALRQSEQFAGEIHLVVSDVIMPGMTGPETVRRLLRHRPKLKILYVSGYTRNAVLEKGLVDEKVNFLEKPISPVTLTNAVRDIVSSQAGTMARPAA